MKYTDITSHKIACEYLGINPDLTLILERYPIEEREKVKATIELLDIGNAVNKLTNFSADLNEDDFYTPFFTGSGFCNSDCHCWASDSYFSSRLHFKTSFNQTAVKTHEIKRGCDLSEYISNYINKLK
jgi:hypothetical protein